MGGGSLSRRNVCKARLVPTVSDSPQVSDLRGVPPFELQLRGHQQARRNRGEGGETNTNGMELAT